MNVMRECPVSSIFMHDGFIEVGGFRMVWVGVVFFSWSLVFEAKSSLGIWWGIELSDCGLNLAASLKLSSST
jgi:hypothetical protein